MFLRESARWRGCGRGGRWGWGEVGIPHPPPTPPSPAPRRIADAIVATLEREGRRLRIRAVENADVDMGRRHPMRRADSRNEFRWQATGAERVLWEVLCDRQVGRLKFRRQHPVKPYILDFCCLERKL